MTICLVVFGGFCLMEEKGELLEKAVIWPVRYLTFMMKNVNLHVNLKISGYSPFLSLHVSHEVG